MPGFKNWLTRIHHRHQEGATWTLNNDPNKSSPPTYTENNKAKYGFTENGLFYSALLALTWRHKKRWDGAGVFSLKKDKGGNAWSTNYVGGKVKVSADGKISIPVQSILYFQQTGIMDDAYIAGHVKASQMIQRKQNQRKRMFFQARDNTQTGGGEIYNLNQNMKQIRSGVSNAGQNYFQGSMVFPESISLTVICTVPLPAPPPWGTDVLAEGVNFLRIILFQFTRPTLQPATGTAAIPTPADVLEYLNPVSTTVWQVCSPYTFENLPYLTIHYDETLNACAMGMSSLIGTTALIKCIKTWKNTGLRRIEFQSTTANTAANDTIAQSGGFYLLTIDHRDNNNWEKNINFSAVFRDAAAV